MSSFFYFNQRERKGALLFFSILSFVFFAPKLHQKYWQADEWVSIEIITLDTIPNEPKALAATLSPRQDSLFSFNPNLVKQAELIALGLTPPIARTLINYRNKGGKFFRKEDLKKIYGVDESWYNSVEDYIVLPEQNRPSKPSNFVAQKPKAKPYYTPKTPIRIEVNTASAEEWAKLRGIGPVLSQRIVKFREKLGGFYDVDQVNETFGLPDSTFQSIYTQLYLESQPQKLFINLSDTEQLAKHPYIDWKLARILVNYRRAHGPFKRADDLKQVYTLDELTLQRLMPYLNYCEDCTSSPNTEPDKE